jgi:hypothetical protein
MSENYELKETAKFVADCSTCLWGHLAHCPQLKAGCGKSETKTGILMEIENKRTFAKK